METKTKCVFIFSKDTIKITIESNDLEMYALAKLLIENAVHVLENNTKTERYIFTETDKSLLGKIIKEN